MESSKRIPKSISLSLPKWHAHEVTVALVGRPNVGKSALMNVLLGEERSLVASIGGTTRDIVEGVVVYNGRKIRILDTAGMRRRSRSKETVEVLSLQKTMDALNKCDVAFLVIDAAEGLVEQEKKIMDQAIKKKRDCALW